MESWQQWTSRERTASIRVLVFLFFPISLCQCGSFFEDRSARNGCCWAWRQRTTASWPSVSSRRLLDAGVESTRELSERSGLCEVTIHFGSQWVAGSKALSMLLVAGQRLYCVSSTDRTCSEKLVQMKQRKNFSQTFSLALIQQQSSSSSSNRFIEHDDSTRKLGPYLYPKKARVSGSKRRVQ